MDENRRQAAAPAQNNGGYVCLCGIACFQGVVRKEGTATPLYVVLQPPSRRHSNPPLWYCNPPLCGTPTPLYVVLQPPSLWYFNPPLCGTLTPFCPGPNMGKTFNNCAKRQDDPERCKFFQFLEADGSVMAKEARNTTALGGGSSGGGGGGYNNGGGISSYALSPCSSVFCMQPPVLFSSYGSYSLLFLWQPPACTAMYNNSH